MNAFQRLCELRWPDGIRCPHCGFDKFYEITTRERLKCAQPACRKQFSPTTGTVFRYRKMAAAQYVKAIEIFPGCSRAAEMQRKLGVDYRTAFNIWHALVSTGGRLQ